jgi:hypothetical protein
LRGESSQILKMDLHYHLALQKLHACWSMKKFATLCCANSFSCF